MDFTLFLKLFFSPFLYLFFKFFCTFKCEFLGIFGHGIELILKHPHKRTVIIYLSNHYRELMLSGNIIIKKNRNITTFLSIKNSTNSVFMLVVEFLPFLTVKNEILHHFTESYNTLSQSITRQSVYTCPFYNSSHRLPI